MFFCFGQTANCSLTPDPGPCLAAITQYYFDQTAQKCDSFTWGGCDGVVPFQTYNDCYVSCELTVGLEHINSYIEKKPLRILNILGQEAEPRPNIILFYIYEDGTIDRKIFIE